MTTPLSPAHIAQMRAAQQSIMTSQVRINRPATRRYNPDTKRDEVVPGTLVYSGRGRVQPTSWTQGIAATGGGESVLRPRYVAAIPWYVEGIMPGQILTIESALHADTVGQQYQVTSVDKADGPAASARRMHCELLGERAEGQP